MTTFHGPMTSTATSIAHSPSLHLIQAPIQSDGKDSGNLDLNKVPDEANTITNFGGNDTLIAQATSVANEIEDLKRQAGTDFAGSSPGNFQYSATSQASDGPQPSLNLASDHHNHLRVMTVHSNDPGQGAVTGLGGANFTISSAGTTQVTQVQNVLSSAEVDNSGQVPASVTVENNAEGTKYTYYPAVQSADASTGAAGQFYVMMSPQDMIPSVSGSNSQRIIAPRGHPIASMGDGTTFTVEAETIPVEFRKVETGGRSSRDERRRATHNEVERRRRDKINTWIMKLATIVPECQEDQTKQGQSKGGILSKTLDYIGKLRTTNERLAETMKDHDRVIVENQVLRQQTEDLRRENALLRANLHMQHQDHTDVTGEAQQMDASH